MPNTLGMPSHYRKHIHAERLLHRCQLKQLIKNYLGNRIAFNLDNNTHTPAV